MTLRYLEMIFIFVVFKFEQFVVLNLIFFLFSGKFNLVVLWNRIPCGKAHCLLWTTKWSKQNKQKSVSFHLAEKWEFILHANSITSFKYFSVEHLLISLLQPHLKNIHKNAEQKSALITTNMSGSFVSGTWKELLPLPTGPDAISEPKICVGFFLPQASSLGLCNLLSEAGIPAREGPQTHLSLGGCLTPSSWPGGWSFCFPEPPARHRLQRAPGSPAQNTARAGGRVEGQGLPPVPAENMQLPLEPKPWSDSSSAAVICVSNKEQRLRSCQSCGLQVSAQAVAASEVLDGGQSGLFVVLHWEQVALRAASLQVCALQQHLELEAIGYKITCESNSSQAPVSFNGESFLLIHLSPLCS